MYNKLKLIDQALNNRFPDGRNPFQMVTRLAEECGEVEREVNHFEGVGVKAEKHGAPDKHKLAKEIRDVRLCALQIGEYYGVEAELEDMVNTSIERARAEGLIE